MSAGTDCKQNLSPCGKRLRLDILNLFLIRAGPANNDSGKRAQTADEPAIKVSPSPRHLQVDTDGLQQ